MRKRSLSASLLAVVYLLYILGIVFSALGGGISVAQIVLTVFSIITLMAIATDVGNWARIFGLIYGCLLITFSFVAFFSADWTGLPDLEGDSVFVIIGFLILGLGVWTIEVLRHKPVAPDAPEQ